VFIEGIDGYLEKIGRREVQSTRDFKKCKITRKGTVNHAPLSDKSAKPARVGKCKKLDKSDAL